MKMTYEQIMGFYTFHNSLLVDQSLIYLHLEKLLTRTFFWCCFLYIMVMVPHLLHYGLILCRDFAMFTLIAFSLPFVCGYVYNVFILDIFIVVMKITITWQIYKNILNCQKIPLNSHQTPLYCFCHHVKLYVCPIMQLFHMHTFYIMQKITSSKPKQEYWLLYFPVFFCHCRSLHSYSALSYYIL